MRINQFLTEVLGLKGVEQLSKSLGEGQFLANAVFSWLKLQKTDYNEFLPGNMDTKVQFKKFDDVYTGQIWRESDRTLVKFQNESDVYLVSLICHLLGSQEPVVLTEKLGDSTDLLVKAEVLQKAWHNRPFYVKELLGGGKPMAAKYKKVSNKESKAKPKKRSDFNTAPTPKAQPTGGMPKPPKPKAPEVKPWPSAQKEATAKASKQLDQMASAVRPKLNKSVTLPGSYPKLNLMKSDVVSHCNTCGSQHFTGPKYTGCMCLKSLAKGVMVKDNGKTYTLSLDPYYFDLDAAKTLLEVLMGKKDDAE